MNCQHALLALLLAITPAAIANAADTTAVPATGTNATQPSAAPAAADKSTATQENHVARAVFTTGIKDREPVDQITTLTNDRDKVYFFTEIHNMSGHIVKHRWQYNGKTMAEVEFGVGGPRWRVWSTKTLLPQWTGEWKVSVIDESGQSLGDATFNYTKK